MHSEPTAAHPGSGVYKDTVRFVKKCRTCQLTKTEQRAQVGLTGIREVDKPWKIIAADLMGEFWRSKSGFPYFIGFKDFFSWFNMRTNSLRAIRHTGNFCIKGREFVSDILIQFLEENLIIQERTPAYHLQSNPVERVNQDLKTRIAEYINDNHKEWDRYIPQFQFTQNANVHSATEKRLM
ncbi:hypothetical protein TSAR_000559 [Trichomalopsis sarcophagae]|uniref:Integrase catalytic domain-containing protein n=1 Tax=Trichomalopsis sarcophagae TaxID=543379 RepID=A0A232F8J9_9HYME|nr:hypothetical protein TSAR_000559 [Trichomalopsis sarcophagae]